MKTLKACRLVTMIASLAIFLVYLLPGIKGESGYDLTMTSILAIVFVFVPAGLMGSMYREKKPESLSEYNKGYMIRQGVCAGLGFCLFLAACFLVPGKIWLYMAFALATTSHLFNAIILYKTRQAYEVEVKPEA